MSAPTVTLPPFPYSGQFTSNWVTGSLQHYRFRLNLAPGTYQISVLPDLAVLTTAPSTITPDDVNAFFPEALISAAEVSRVVQSSSTGTSESLVDRLESTPDALAIQQMADAGIVGHYGGDFSYYTDTVTIEAAKTITYPSGAQDTYTSEYYLNLSGYNYSYTHPDSGNPISLNGRFLVTVGDPTGQRTAQWGSDWLNIVHLTSDTPPPPPQDIATPQELADLANAAYHPPGQVGSWRQVDLLSDGEFQGVAYANADGSAVVLAIRGTNLGDGLQWSGFKNALTDAASFSSGAPTSGLRSMVADAAYMLSKLVSAYPKAEIHLTGHSLGGAIAQLLGQASGYATTSFNAPGTEALYADLTQELQPALILGQRPNAGSERLNYRTVGDPVSLFGQHSETTLTLLTGEPVNPWDLLGNHGMDSAMLPAIKGANTQAIDGVAELPEALRTMGGLLLGTAGYTPPGAALLQFVAQTNAITNWYDPDQGTDFLFTVPSSSPGIASIAFPDIPGVTSYRVWSQTNAAWSAAQTVRTGEPATFAAGTHTLRIQGLDATGTPVLLENGLVFQLGYHGASNGQAQLLTLTRPAHLATSDIAQYGDLLIASDEHPSLTGTPRNDTLLLKKGANLADGGAGNDLLLGSDGDDKLMGAQGNDSLQGGLGDDTALYQNPTGSYRLRPTPNGWALEHLGGSDGLDTLSGMELLQFTDRQVHIAARTHGDYSDLPIALYHFFVVAFNAAPGVTYMDQLAEAYRYGLSVKDIVNVFTTKPQFTSVYPSTLTAQELASELVTQIVKQSASDAARQQAEQDIVEALSIGWSVGDVIYTVFGNLAHKPINDADWGNTARQFQHEVEVARYYTETLEQSTTDLTTLRQVLASVNEHTDVSSDTVLATLVGVALMG